MASFKGKSPYKKSYHRVPGASARLGTQAAILHYRTRSTGELLRDLI
jgi:hypothetical protein